MIAELWVSLSLNRDSSPVNSTEFNREMNAGLTPHRRLRRLAKQSFARLEFCGK